MITSRKQGILVLKTIKPYKMAKGGNYSDATEIICREYNSETDGIAFDIEQMFRIAMTDIQSRRKNKEPTTSDFDDELSKINSYEENDNPTLEEVEENASSLEIMFSMNKEIKVSELLALWLDLLDAGLIRIEGDLPMTHVTWNTIDPTDKLRIMYGYISFFVKPVYRLEKSYLAKEKAKPGNVATAGNGTLLE